MQRGKSQVGKNGGPVAAGPLAIRKRKAVGPPSGGGESDDSSSSSSSSDDFVNYGPITFLLHPYTPYDKLAVEYFNEDNVSAEARQVVESGRQGNYPWAGDVRGEDADEFPLEEFGQWMNGGPKSIVKSHVGGKGSEKAKLVIIFGTLSFDRLLDEQNDEEFDGTLKEGMEAIWGGRIMGGADVVITAFSNGIIGNVVEAGGIQKSLELENWELPCLSGLAIPKVAKELGIKGFVVTEKENRKLEKDFKKKKIPLAKCKVILGITDEIEGKLKGIVFFHSTVDRYTEYYRTCPVVSVLHTYLKANPHVAMAGGLHPTLLSRGTSDKDVLACGFLVFGDDDKVRVNCAALLEKRMTEGNKEKLEKLKVNFLTTEKEDEEVSSFGIMFGCYERGHMMHGRYGVETGYFNEIFPKVKLVGTFDYGEFYREILDAGGKDVERGGPETIHDTHLSAFFLVSYVHPPY